jgi:hypothetical protein
LFGVHSRYGLHTRTVTLFRDSFTEGFNYLVTSIVAPVASGWSPRRVRLSPTGKRRLFTAHANTGPYHRSLAFPVAVIAACCNFGFSPTPRLLAHQLKIRL